jgi:PIN domain nuclease of toxin-antitoxin system
LIVLDTHAWIWWWSEEPDALSAAAMRAIETADEIGISTLCCYEVALAERRQRVILDRDIRAWIASAVRDERVRILPPTVEIATQAAALAWEHWDPFDRVIVATAIVHRAPLVTKDDRIRRFAGVTTIW